MKTKKNDANLGLGLVDLSEDELVQVNGGRGDCKGGANQSWGQWFLSLVGLGSLGSALSGCPCGDGTTTVDYCQD
jgi:hypothetical protein